jgi:hypothetical protein
MVIVVLTPVDAWRQPYTDAVYHGFDPNLIYLGAEGNDAHEAVVGTSGESLRLTPFPGTTSTVHLLAADRDFRTDMDITVRGAPSDSKPLRIVVWRPALWQPLMISGAFWEFGPKPDYKLAFVVVRKGKDSLGGTGGPEEVLVRREVGSYVLGKTYHVSLMLDSKSGVITSRIKELAGLPNEGNILMVRGPDEIGVSHPIRVWGGKWYTFGAHYMRVEGNGAFAVGIYWWDRDGRRLPITNYWVPTTGASSWESRQITVQAPADAAGATVYVSASADVVMLFTDIFLREKGNSINRLRNGNFRLGPRGWHSYPYPAEPLQIVSIPSEGWVASVNAREAPLLFQKIYEARPVALTLYSASGHSVADVVLSNYTVTLPHWRGWAVKTQDTLLETVLLLLAVFGAVAITAVVWPYLRSLPRLIASVERVARNSDVIHLAPVPFLLSLAAVAYFVINAIFFHVDGINNNLTTDAINAYIGAKYGLSGLYFLSNIESHQAMVWGGFPLTSGYFVYGPLHAYTLVLLGWIYRLFLSRPTGVTDFFEMGMLIKSLDVAFCIADVYLIYLILVGFGVSRRGSFVSSLLFALNPAVFVVDSLWGTTHAQSIFYMLASILMAQRGAFFWSWLSLIVAPLTRAQMLVPSVLLAAILWRVFGTGRNIRPASLAVITAFLLFLPAMFATSASLPLDNFLYTSRIQNFPEKSVSEAQPVGAFAYNIWPIAAGFIGGESGLERFRLPESAKIFGSLSCLQVSNVLFFGWMGGLIAIVLMRPTRPEFEEYHVLVLSAGLLATLILKTGIESTHFILALPLLIILWGLGKWRVFYLPSVLAYSGVTLIAVTAQLGSILSPIPGLEPWMSPQHNWLTQLIYRISLSDKFITGGSLINVLCFLGIVREIVQGWTRGKRNRGVGPA